MVHVISSSANTLATISIRYEGGRAASHEIDLNLLGRSIQGFARILLPCSNLLCTGTLIEPFDAPSMSVVALPVG